MEQQRIALFGEAEKGEFQKPYFCKNLPSLVDYLGEPPPESRGLFFAIQALLYERKVIYFRVEEEGFSHEDYFQGLYKLSGSNVLDSIVAFCTPGLSDKEVLDEFFRCAKKNQGYLFTTEQDLYDYLSA